MAASFEGHLPEDLPDEPRIERPEVLLPVGDEHPAHLHRAGADTEPPRPLPVSRHRGGA